MEMELIAASRMKCKKIVHVHSTSCQYKVLHKLLYHKFMKSYDYSVACSNAAGKWLYNDKEFVVFKNGIELKKFLYNSQIRKDIRNELGICETSVVVGHVGNFNEVKNHRFLIDIFEQLYLVNPKARLLLIGDGPLLEKIKASVAYKNLSEAVIFLGSTLRVAEYMQAMDIFVMPSLYEGLAMAGIEAQSSGLPCIFSDKVSKEIKLTTNVRFLSLDDSINNWVKVIIEMLKKDRNQEAVHEIKKSGYDIMQNGYNMQKFYKMILKDK